MPTLLPPAAPASAPVPTLPGARPGRRLGVAGAAAVVGLLVSSVVPLLGPLLVAMLLGVAAANTPLLRTHVAPSPALDRLLLRAGIVLLGLKVAVADVLDLGLGGLVVVVVTLATTYAATQAAGRALGLDRTLTTLVAAGFSVCGAAAVAAVGSSVRARPRDVALAVALVTVFGTAMIALVPALGHLLGLTDRQIAVWAGASIHEVAQVVAAASLVSGGAITSVAGAAVLATATTVKLARVALLAPVQVASARVCRQDDEPRRGPLVPGFVLGFLALVAVRSTGLVPAGAIDLAGSLTTALLAAAMFGLGTTIVARQLWPVPLRVLALAALATIVVAGVSLALVVTLV